MSRDIRNRIKSLTSTRQIAKAMELVASSKLRRAQSALFFARPYFQSLSSTMEDIVAQNRDFSSPYLQERPGSKALYIVIAGDRGLAGGYNSNILKPVENQIRGRDAVILPIGKKCVDHCRAHRLPTQTDKYSEAADLDASQCFSIANQLSNAFLSGEFDEVYVAYTRFVSVLSQTTAVKRLLPLSRNPAPQIPRCDTVYEPDAETVFAAIVPEYLGGILYGALCESRAAEFAARRMAMNAASQNADEMIADLRLQYNRARQAAITQEITEIVAGS